MRKEWKERREECSALGIGEREAEEAGAREGVIELLSLLPFGLYFTLGLPSFLLARCHGGRSRRRGGKSAAVK